MSPAQRAALYGLFARLLTESPGPALRADLCQPGLGQTLVAIQPALADWLTSKNDGPVAQEYARLFLLPKGTPPFASAWIEGDSHKVAEQLATLMHRAMTAFDMKQTQLQGRLSLDHLGLSFAVLAQVLVHERPESQALAAHLETQLLGPWVPRFGQALADQAQHPLYLALGEMIVEARRV
ncbi:MAG: TorA maturation chaperone TorD [Cognaticolwellia sp.]